MEQVFQMYPQPKQHFLCFTLLEHLDTKPTLTIYLHHQHTKQILFLTLAQSIPLKYSDGEIFPLSPKTIASIIHKDFDKMTVSQTGEVSLKVEILYEMVSLKFPPFKTDVSRNIITEIRIKMLEREMQEMIHRFQGKIEKINEKIEAKEKSQVREQTLPLIRIESPSLLQIHSQTSEKQDKRTNEILENYSKQQAELLDANIQRLAEDYARKYLDKMMQERDKRIIELQKKLQNTTEALKNMQRQLRQGKELAVKTNRKVEELQQVVSRIEQSSPSRINRNDLFDQFQQSQYSTITRISDKLAKIKNIPGKSAQAYCSFFSKLQLKPNSVQSFHFKFLIGEKQMVGICSRQAFKSGRIYEHPSSYFWLVGEKGNYHIGGKRPQEEESMEDGLMEDVKEVRMKVDLAAWVIEWQVLGQSSEKIQEYTIQKSESNQEFYLAILMNSKKENSVILSYAEF